MILIHSQDIIIDNRTRSELCQTFFADFLQRPRCGPDSPACLPESRDGADSLLRDPDFETQLQAALPDVSVQGSLGG